MEETILHGLANNGFAAIVAGFLLFEINKTVSKLVDWVIKWQVKVDMVVSVREKEGEKNEVK